MEPRSALRPFLAFVLATAWVLVAWFGISISEIAAPRLGWLFAAAVFATGLAVAGFVWGGERRSVVLALLGVVALVLGFALWTQSPPSADRVRDRADGLSMPDGWERTARRTEDRAVGLGASDWEVVSTYRSDEASYAASAEELSAALEDQGWQEYELSRQGDGAFALTRDGWSVLVTRGVRADGSSSGQTLNVAVRFGDPAY
jgi:hypothetical protein